jgi:hypothetical protein
MSMEGHRRGRRNRVQWARAIRACAGCTGSAYVGAWKMSVKGMANITVECLALQDAGSVGVELRALAYSDAPATALVAACDHATVDP